MSVSWCLDCGNQLRAGSTLSCLCSNPLRLLQVPSEGQTPVEAEVVAGFRRGTAVECIEDCCAGTEPFAIAGFTILGAYGIAALARNGDLHYIEYLRRVNYE